LQVLYELPASTNWNFDVQWSARIPGLLSTSSFDGKVQIYNIEVRVIRNLLTTLIWRSLLSVVLFLEAFFAIPCPFSSEGHNDFSFVFIPQNNKSQSHCGMLLDD
jgi:hypothetical protein